MFVALILPHALCALTGENSVRGHQKAPVLCLFRPGLYVWRSRICAKVSMLGTVLDRTFKSLISFDRFCQEASSRMYPDSISWTAVMMVCLVTLHLSAAMISALLVIGETPRASSSARQSR